MRTLTSKLLTAIHDADSVHHAEETVADPEAVQEPVNEPGSELKEVTQDMATEESAPPQATRRRPELLGSSS